MGTCATYPPSLLYEGKTECERVWVPTLLVELVSLVSLASVSLIPLVTLLSLAFREGFGVGVCLQVFQNLLSLVPLVELIALALSSLGDRVDF